MIAYLKPYPAMKDSGVEWLGEVRRLKRHVASIVDQTSDRGADEIYVALEHVESWTGRIRKAGPAVSFDSQVKLFRVEDVLFGKLRPYLAKVTRYFYKPQPAHRGGNRSRTDAEGVCEMNSSTAQTNQQINAIVPRNESLPYWAFFMAKDLKPLLEAMGGGATMTNVNKSKFSNIKVVIPSAPVLDQFNSFVANQIDQIEQLALINLQLAKARDLLLPRLMNGEVAV